MIKFQDILIIPIVAFLIVFQLSLVGRIGLINGTADIVMVTIAALGLIHNRGPIWIWTIVTGLFVSYVSALPFMIPLISYVLLTLITQFIKERVRQMPILVMIFVTVLGSAIFHLLSFLGMTLSGSTMPFWESIALIIVPSAVLNLLLSIPVFILISDFVNFLNPKMVEE